MAQAVLTLTGTKTGEWDSTPVTAENLHHTLVSDAYPPGDNTSYLKSGGHVAGKIEEHYLSAGGSNILFVTNVYWQALANGITFSDIPAIRLEVVLDGTVIGFREFSFEGTWVDLSINIPVNVLGSAWMSGVRSIRWTPISGNSGYPYIPTELDHG